MISLKQGVPLLLLALLSLPPRLHAAPASFDIDLKELDRQESAGSPKTAKKPVRKVKKGPSAARTGKVRRSHADNADYLRYTVRPGDHIFKILVVRFGMSNEAAERLVPEIARLNDISNMKSLTVGRTLLIPGEVQQERVARPAKKVARLKRKQTSEAAAMLDAAARLDTDGAEAPAVQVVPPIARETTPVTHALPVPAPPVAPPVAAAAPVIPAVIAEANTWICSVTQREPASMVDAVLNALSVSWSKNRILQSDEGAPSAFSIRVDRYFEHKGGRYIVSIGEDDPYSYTLIRLLEGAGYRVLRISGGEDFKTVSGKLLGLTGVVPDFGKHALQGGRETTGFLIQQDDAGGRRVVITGEPVDPHLKWVMAPGCGTR